VIDFLNASKVDAVSGCELAALKPILAKFKQGLVTVFTKQTS